MEFWKDIPGDKAPLEREVGRSRELDVRLREAEYREQAELLDLTNDAIFVRGLDSTILYWNCGAERSYGWKKEEALGKISHDLLQTKFPVPLSKIEAEVYEKGSWEGELIHHRRDGAQIIVSSRWALQSDASGKPVRILEVNRDITQRKIQEDQFHRLLECAPDAMVIVDREGRIRLVNAQTEKLFGYSREELVGKPVEILVPERFRHQHAEDRDGYAQSPKSRAMGPGLELFGRRKDGSELPVEISLSPIETEQGVLVASAIRDVTERRRADEQIRELNAELKKRVAELGLINKELETFSYSVSHDLRAPLRHIDGFARILKEEHAAELSPEAQNHLERILHAVSHMAQLIDDLLNLAHIGRRGIVRERVKLDRVVQEAIAELPSGTNGRSVDWRIRPLPEADCDPGLMKVVFSNLLLNAVKFSRNQPDARIEVGTLPNAGSLTFFVRDNGVGFNPQCADKLFGVFQRLHTEREFEGTGVGLATVQRIVHRHGGEIWAESKPGEGATFFFTLDGHRAETQAQKRSGEVNLGIA
ncbi:MAG TPA: PAS domain S-box protein [Candidatus Acidoferrum sp.]|nr:PAS domain S-box protein [Candidatus Acidoferrum sp.]